MVCQPKIWIKAFISFYEVVKVRQFDWGYAIRPFSVVSMEFENDTQHIMHIILQTVVSLFGNRLENDCFSNNLILSVNGNFPNI